MISIYRIQQKFFFIFLALMASQVQGAQQKYDGLPAPYCSPEAEKANTAARTYTDIIGFDVKNVTKDVMIELFREYGFKLPAKHWSVAYDSLMFYAQIEFHLPPLEDFPLEMQTTIKAHWERAQKLGAHLIDCQGIYYLTKTLKLPIAAEQWPISKYDFIYFLEKDISLPPLEDFTVERQKKILELLKMLGDKAPRISKPKPEMPILASNQQAPTAPNPLTTSPTLAPVYVPVHADTQPIISPYVSPSLPSSTSSTSIALATTLAAQPIKNQQDFPDTEAAYVRDNVAYMHEDYSDYSFEDDYNAYEDYNAYQDDTTHEDYDDAAHHEPTQENLPPVITESSSVSTDLLLIEPLPLSSSLEAHKDLLIYEPSPEETSMMNLLIIEPSVQPTHVEKLGANLTPDLDLMTQFSKLSVVEPTPAPMTALTSSIAAPTGDLVQSILDLYDAPNKSTINVGHEDLLKKFAQLRNDLPNIQLTPAHKPHIQQPFKKSEEDDDDAYIKNMEQRLRALKEPIKESNQVQENPSSKKEKRVKIGE